MSEQHEHVEEIIYADGTIGYRNSPMISNDKSMDGKAVEVVGVNDLMLTPTEFRDKVQASNDLKAEIMNSHDVVIRPKTDRERRDEFGRAQAQADRVDQLKQEARKRRPF